MRQITTLGIDTAKQVFQLHGVDAQGNTVLHKRMSRKQVLPLLAQLPPCLVGLEAQGSSWFPLHICGVKPTVSEALQFNQQVCGGEAKHTLHPCETPR